MSATNWDRRDYLDDPRLASFLRQLKTNHHHFFGYGDLFYAAYVNLDSCNSTVGGGYNLPLLQKPS